MKACNSIHTFQRFFGSNTAKCSFLRNEKASLWRKVGSGAHELGEREGQEEEHVEEAIEGGAENSGVWVRIALGFQYSATYLAMKRWRRCRRRRRQQPRGKFWRALGRQRKREWQQERTWEEGRRRGYQRRAITKNCETYKLSR